MCRIPDIGETTPILNNNKYKNINSEATGSEATGSEADASRAMGGSPAPFSRVGIAAPRYSAGRGKSPASPVYVRVAGPCAILPPLAVPFARPVSFPLPDVRHVPALGPSGGF